MTQCSRTTRSLVCVPFAGKIGILLSIYTWNLADLVSIVNYWKQMHQVLESLQEKNSSLHAGLTMDVEDGLYSKKEDKGDGSGEP